MTPIGNNHYIKEFDSFIQEEYTGRGGFLPEYVIYDGDTCQIANFFGSNAKANAWKFVQMIEN